MLNPKDAWSPLPIDRWDAAHARHLLRRTGFAATPDAVGDALKRGLFDTVRYYMGSRRPFRQPTSLDGLPAMSMAMQREMRQLSEEERRARQQELQRLQREVFADFALAWLHFARQTDQSVQEKLVLFLQNIFVVAYARVRDPAQLFDHQSVLRDGINLPYPDLCKAVTRSPAMIQYLDLQSSRREAPNENYARELFELFTLGEGHYTEQDIKEAARAFTGIRIREGAYFFDRRAHDDSPKTIFGRTGRWGPDDVIDLVFEQPAANRHLPREFIKAYMHEDGIDETYITALGNLWQQRRRQVGALAELVFTSRLFYEPAYQANLIKSPIHFYLGLCQDLNVAVTPFPGPALIALRGMGQDFFNPPNVRGWVGGKMWINAATLASRRQVVQTLFNPSPRRNLNADDQQRLEQHEASGQGPWYVDNTRLAQPARWNHLKITQHFCAYFLPGEVSTPFHTAILHHLHENRAEPEAALRDVMVALLQSPQYHLS